MGAIAGALVGFGYGGDEPSKREPALEQLRWRTAT